MISYLVKQGDTAHLRIISGKQSKLVAAVNGHDTINIDSTLNDLVDDKKIKHVYLSITYTDDEDGCKSFLLENQQESNNECCVTPDGKCKCEDKEEEKCYNEYTENVDYTCPECGEDDCALYDKFGHKYPCFNCIKIDIGKQLEKKYKDTTNDSLSYYKDKLNKENDEGQKQ